MAPHEHVATELRTASWLAGSSVPQAAHRRTSEQRRQARLRSLLIAALLSALALALFTSLPAMALPPTCKPTPGGTQDCAAPVPGPYLYVSANCSMPGVGAPSEAAALAGYEAEFPPGSCPPVPLGWVSPSAPMCANGPCSIGAPIIHIACGGYTYAVPGFNSGIETMNWLTFRVEYDSACQPRSHYVIGAVKRERPVMCPRGYGKSGDVCVRNTAIDPIKNLGGTCPTCGNPISMGTGNKFQLESDYSSGGEFPLVFARYYNSQMRVNDNESSYFSVSGFSGGLDGWRALGVNQYRTGSLQSGQDRRDAMRWSTVGIDMIGANWRHTYQRSIYYLENGASGASTAFVFRHDGKVLPFVEYGGGFYAQADIDDRLSGSPTTGWTYIAAPNDEVETYDTDGRLISIRSRGGLTHSLVYDADGRLTSVTDDFGRALTFSYDEPVGSPSAVARISSMTDPGGGVHVYGYTGANLTSVTHPDLTARQYVYAGSTPRALTSIVDESAATYATFAYSSSGKATLSTHAGGADQVSISYAQPVITNWGPATVTDALGTARTYYFTNVLGVAKVTSIVEPAANGSGTKTTSYTYDVNGNVVSRIDFNGNRTCYAYDLARNLETVRVEGFAAGISCPSNLAAYTPATGTRQRKISTQWHSALRLPTQIDESGRRTTFNYDTSGNVLTKTVLDTATSESRTWTYTYSAFGRVLTADGPRTDVADITTYTYYSCATGYQCGRVQTITNAANHSTTYNTYNAHGQPLTITDPNGIVTTLTYDARQRLTSRTVDTEQTTFNYWPTGLLRKVTLPDSSFLEYTYDAAHRLTEVADSEGNRIVHTLDAMGNRTAENLYDPSNLLTQTRTRVFNTLNQLFQEIGVAGTALVTTTFSYDDNGNRTGISAPLVRNTVQGYDELTRLKQITDPLAGLTQYGYNALDQLISVTDPRGKITNYTYSALDDLTEQVSPDTGATTNTYDSGGNLQTSTDARSKTATYAYDALNRVSSVTYPDQTITFNYDSGANQLGRLTQVTDSSGATSWTYDAHGRTLSRQQSMGGISKTLGYAYDYAGRLGTLTLPSGNAIVYGYTDGKLTNLTLNGSTTILSNVLYQPFGPTRGWTWGNGTLAVREYDTEGKVVAIDSAGLKTYAYDDALRIRSISDATDPSLGATYDYDALDRLSSYVSGAPATPTVTPSATSVTAGSAFSVTMSGIPAGSDFWAALSTPNASASTYSKWSAVTPAGGSYVWNVTAPDFPGTYEVRLFAAGFDRRATSVPITITAAPPPAQPQLAPSVSATAPGATVTVRLTSGPGTASDWMSLAQPGTHPLARLQWTVVGSGVTSRDWTVTLPATPGAYEFRLFTGSPSTKIATSPQVTVTNAPPVAPVSSGYTYDANGNRLSGEGSTYTISNTSNRLSSISGALTRTYSYDNAGNTTGDGVATFTYDDAGRMVSATKAGVTMTYALNALGQRVRKTSAGSSRYFVYDEAGHLIGEYDDAGSLIQETVWFGDTPVATLRPNGGGVSLFYIHTDHLNTPRRISRPSDNVVVWRWDSDPFGATSANEDPDGDSSSFAYGLRFPGQYFDAETGQHYNYFRDYDPTTGRYPQSDPIGLDGGINTYAYVAANPIGLTDPTGESPLAIPAAEACLSNPACAVPAGAATGVALTCIINPDLCKTAIDLACEDLSNAFDQLNKPMLSQDKKLSPEEIKKLKGAGIDPERLKGSKHTGALDLFKDKKGNIKVKPKDGSGPGEDTGINIKDL